MRRRSHCRRHPRARSAGRELGACSSLHRRRRVVKTRRRPKPQSRTADGLDPRPWTDEQRKSGGARISQAFDHAGVTSGWRSILSLSPTTQRSFSRKWGIASGKGQIGIFRRRRWPAEGDPPRLRRSTGLLSSATSCLRGTSHGEHRDWPWRPVCRIGGPARATSSSSALEDPALLPYLDPDYAGKDPPCYPLARRP